MSVSYKQETSYYCDQMCEDIVSKVETARDIFRDNQTVYYWLLGKPQCIR